MKTININKWTAYILLVALLFAYSACKKYTPVYHYDETEKITVTDLASLYQVTSGIDVLNIDPKVSSNKDGELVCLWGIYETNTQGTTPVVDTIARTKKLEYRINRSAKDWYLMFRVTNKKTGYAQYFKSTVQVGTPYTRGWYVPKDDGKQTDMDFFITPANSSLPNGPKVDDVYSLINGKKLDGKAMMLNIFINFKSLVNGSYVSTRSLGLVSERDVAMMEFSNLQTYRDFNNIFQVVPATRNMGMITSDFLKYFLINDGKLYSMVGQGLSEGVFSGQKLLTSNNNPYSLSKYHITPTPGTAYFFDDLKGAFYAATDQSLYLNAVNISTALFSTGPPIVPAANAVANKIVVYMGTKVNASSGGGSPQGYAIFQDKITSEKTMFQVSSQGPNGVGLMQGVTIAPGNKLYNATNYGLLIGDENLLYFSVGKEIYSRNLSSPVAVESLQYTVPAEEEITFIRHRKLSGADGYNYIMVGTQVGQNYKIRMFKKTAGNLNATADFVLEGKGRAVDALYVSPTVNTELIYAYTF